MSVHVMSWVLRESEETLGNRLVLLAIADFCDDEGENCWAAVEKLAHKARLTKRQTQRVLRTLEANGAIEETAKTRHGTHVYRVIMGATNSHPGGDIYDTEGATSTPEGVSRMSPDPSVKATVSSEPSEELARARASSWSVDRKPVSTSEGSAAISILGYWNEKTGQTLTAKSWLNKIIMRIREHPVLTVADHVAILDVALRSENRWWSGPATPSVVYGSDAQFERCMMQARGGGRAPAEEAYDIAARAAAEARGKTRPSEGFAEQGLHLGVRGDE